MIRESAIKIGIDLSDDINSSLLAHINFNTSTHTLVYGETGTGKTVLSKNILIQLPLRYNVEQLFVLDFKGQDFIFLNGVNGYYSYKECIQGFNTFFDLFSKRQESGLANFDKHLFLFIDEYVNWLRSINYEDPKTYKEILAKVQQIIFLGRSFKVHIIISTQRPDAKYFEDGTRGSLSTVIAMGPQTQESKKMMFPKEEIDDLPNYYGYVRTRTIPTFKFKSLLFRPDTLEKLQIHLANFMDRANVSEPSVSDKAQETFE